MSDPTSLRTPIKRARGLGSAHTGVHHFWVQRVSALAIVPLSIWFMITMVTQLMGGDQATVTRWLQQPISALLMGALVVSMFIHARIGMMEIIEDYVHCKGKKLATILLLNTLIYGFGAASLMAIVRLHFFGL